MTEKTTDENWENELLQCDRNINESCAINDTNKVESDDEQDEQHSLREIWEFSQKIYGYALKTNNTALFNYMLKAQDELKKDKVKAVQNQKQTVVESFFPKIFCLRHFVLRLFCSLPQGVDMCPLLKALRQPVEV